MLELDTKLMHSDILKRLNSIKKPQRYITDKLGISRSTFWRLSTGQDITMETFLTLVNWLEKEPNRYIKKTKNEKKNSIYNRSS